MYLLYYIVCAALDGFSELYVVDTPLLKSPSHLSVYLLRT